MMIETRNASPPPKRKRAAHLGPERRRPVLLDAALDLFLQGGYEGTSMEAIAAAAGVTKPVIYDSFSSKDELFRTLMAREEERILAEIRIAFADGDLADPARTLTEGFTGFLRAVAASPEVYRLIVMGEGGGNAALASRIRRGRESQIEALSNLALGWLDLSGRKAGPETQADARLFGHLMVGLAESGARLILSEPETWTPEQLGKRLGRLAATAALASA